MANTVSKLTFKIVAFPELEQGDINESIDWAIEMMELGYESPTLYMLASFSKPANYFEIINYVRDAVLELGLELKFGEEASLSFASYYVNQIVKGDNVRENLSELHRFCEIRDYEDSVFDFSLLYWAWDQLDYEDIRHNHYWQGARRTNIEMIVRKEAKRWIERNHKQYAQPEL
jgi:hypothetical protein